MRVHHLACNYDTGLTDEHENMTSFMGGHILKLDTSTKSSQHVRVWEFLFVIHEVLKIPREMA